VSLFPVIPARSWRPEHSPAEVRFQVRPQPRSHFSPTSLPCRDSAPPCLAVRMAAPSSDISHPPLAHGILIPARFAPAASLPGAHHSCKHVSMLANKLAFSARPPLDRCFQSESLSCVMAMLCLAPQSNPYVAQTKSRRFV
jgi:hypothetical protein